MPLDKQYTFPLSMVQSTSHGVCVARFCGVQWIHCSVDLSSQTIGDCHFQTCTEDNVHQSVSFFYFSPPNSTQNSSSEDSDDQGHCTIILWCRVCGRREEDLGDNAAKWTPLGFVHKYLCLQERDDQRSLSKAVTCILTPLDIQVVFCLLSTLRNMLVHPKGLVSLDE